MRRILVRWYCCPVVFLIAQAISFGHAVAADDQVTPVGNTKSKPPQIDDADETVEQLVDRLVDFSDGDVCYAIIGLIVNRHLEPAAYKHGYASHSPVVTTALSRAVAQG